MKTELLPQQLDSIQELTRLRDIYKTMADLCEDICKQLIGYTPDEFVFTFTIKKQPVVSIEITEDNAPFCLGTFTSWAGYYKQLLRKTNERLRDLSSKAA